ncbi:hypothetical protein BbiDN127_E0007 (plasmid) [Borreliella bissettiae DN127]|uniref:Uncharacterized protein n=1 Tax=Borrelia bissettiae (strain DSM 17990 / CIP 109136 / DN127) TaxID=521010 RepID=G0AP18_BORBD|nr:hypothetical protein BbiDN127_E0007 [Borreliella bissettiae DN127]
MDFYDFIIKLVFKDSLSFKNFVKLMSFYHSHKIHIGTNKNKVFN